MTEQPDFTTRVGDAPRWKWTSSAWQQEEARKIQAQLDAGQTLVDAAKKADPK